MPNELADAYRLYFPLLVRKCARMLGDGHEAEDLAQETFIRFARSELDRRDPRAVTAWLYRTSTRLALDRLRGRRRESAGGAALTDHDAQDLRSPEAALFVSSLLIELEKRAPAPELEAALLTRVDGLSQGEVAEVMGIHERSVRRLLARFEQRVVRLRERSEA